MFKALPTEVEAVSGGQEDDLIRVDSITYLHKEKM